jgi:aspartyl aminopeptidase
MTINEYIEFLSQNKTERECVTYAERILRNNGFKTRNEYHYLKTGDKVYYKNKDKNIAAFVIGKQGIRDKGVNLLGAHIDSPRLDVKTQPLYEDTNMAYFDLQYYGGIKKYQWVTRPLAIHGVVCKLDGAKIPVKMGDVGSGFTFCITDLLPHLDKTPKDKPLLCENGEMLDLLLGTMKIEKSDNEDEPKDPVKKNILKILKDQYGIEEDDFLSAELEVVPADNATYVGMDKSMVGGYGQDDRVCAWTSLMAVVDVSNEALDRTVGCVLVDKEEVGSICATGSESRWLEDVLCDVTSQDDQVHFGKILSNTNMLSSDVSAAYDPLYGDVSNKDMTCKLGGGFMLSKYNGGRGKSGGADANPEFIAAVRKTLNDAGTKYQFDTMGKVDVGGGGTIASIVCRLNINVMDAGVPVLNMHSPMEITHVDDITNTYEGYKAFLKSDINIF